MPVLDDIPGVGDVFDLALVSVFDNPIQSVSVGISPDSLLLFGIRILGGTFGQVLGIGYVRDGEVVRVFERISDLVGQIISERIFPGDQDRRSAITDMVGLQLTGEHEFDFGCRDRSR